MKYLKALNNIITKYCEYQINNIRIIRIDTKIDCVLLARAKANSAFLSGLDIGKIIIKLGDPSQAVREEAEQLIKSISKIGSNQIFKAILDTN
jgi:hypothetical protein